MLRAALLAAALLLAFPSAVSGHHTVTHERCTALITELNAYRAPDVRTLYALCIIGRERSKQMAAAETAWHDIRYVVRRLGEMDVCWRNVGEAIGYTNYTGDKAQRFLSLWRGSSSHWSMLSSRIYDRAGGSWTPATDGRTYAAFYVMDAC